MWISFVLTFVVIFICLVLLLWVRTPFYRLKADNIIALFDLVLSGRASINDWQVFIGVPIHSDDRLESVRLRCEALTESDYIGDAGDKFLFNQQGLAAIEVMRGELLALKREVD